MICLRLGRVLKLPPLLGHPPCPPRVYKKLFAFLDRSLKSSLNETKRSDGGGSGSTSGVHSKKDASGPSTPSKGTVERTPSKSTTVHGAQGTPTRQTPLKRMSNGTPKHTTPSRSSTQKTAAKTRSNAVSGSTTIPDAPAWIMANIRTVCKTLSAPAPRTSAWSRPPVSRTLPPHIFAGVSSILHFVSELSLSAEESVDEEILEFLEPITSTTDLQKDKETIELVNALMVAIYFLVLARRRNPSLSTAHGDGNTVNGSSSNGTKKLDKKTFAEMRQTALISLGLPPMEKKHGYDVDQWIALTMDLGWADGREWFENVPMAGEREEEDEDLAEEGLYDGDQDEGIPGSRRRDAEALLSEDISKTGLLPGLGTMMQDRVHWLSEDRQDDYIVWKADIMRRIKKLERSGKAT